jgi:SOS-response transcriptional repressor LexA
MVTITPRQEQILEFLQDYHAEHQNQPTMKEIADGVGLRSAQAAAYQISQLAAKGLAEHNSRKSRSVRFLPGTLEAIRENTRARKDLTSSINLMNDFIDRCRNSVEAAVKTLDEEF